MSSYRTGSITEAYERESAVDLVLEQAEKLKTETASDDLIEYLSDWAVIDGHNNLRKENVDELAVFTNKFEKGTAKIAMKHSGVLVLLDGIPKKVTEKEIKKKEPKKTAPMKAGSSGTKKDKEDKEEKPVEEEKKIEEVEEPEKEDSGSESSTDQDDLNEYEDVDYGRVGTLEEVTALLKESQFKFDAKKLLVAMNSYLESIPKGESYSSKEIEIFSPTDAEFTVQSLVACGTLILDALMFLTFQDDENAVEMFDIKATTLVSIPVKLVKMRVEKARKCFIALTVCIFTRGNMLTVATGRAEERPLPSLIKNMLFKGKWENESDVAENLSCTDTTKFPAFVMLDMKIDLLPEQYHSRIKLSVAGAKVLRYAVFAAEFEKAPIPDLEKEVSMDKLERFSKLKLANDIVKKLQEYASSLHCQLKLHPLNPKRSAPVKFSLKATAAILYSLSMRGRKALARAIIDRKILSWSKDISLMGVVSEDGNRMWPILDDTGANFAGMSVAEIDLIFK